MKFIISVIIIALLSFAICLYLPWWSISIVGFIVSLLIPQSSTMSFLSGFFALLLLWGGLSLWISYNNDHILAHKISLVIFKIDNPYLLMLTTALIGAIISGMGATTASFLKNKKVI